MAANLRVSINRGLSLGLRQSVSGSLGERPGLFDLAALDLRFAETKSLVDSITGNSLATFSRASIGTYIDDSGERRTAAVDTPRFDHDLITGESLGLLVEEERTNLLLNSEILSTQIVTVTATAHTLSFYGTGTVTLSGASTTGPLVGTGADDRVELTFTPTAGSLTVTVSGSVTKAQLEVGSFPTSYIPTTNSSATRAADVVSIGGANFMSFYNQTEGTIFTDHRIQGTESSNGRVWKLTTANRLFYRSTGVLETNTSTQYLSFPGTVGVTGFTKTAVAIKENDHAGFNSNDGVLRTANSGTTAAAVLLCIGCTQSGYQLNGHIKRLTYFNTRLSDATLSSIAAPSTTPSFLEYVTTSLTSSFTLRSSGTVAYQVDWGDGTVESSASNSLTHLYSAAGGYVIKITPAAGSTYRPYFNDRVSDTSIAEISGTGGSQLGTVLSDAWEGATNLTGLSSAIDVSSVANFSKGWRDTGLVTFPSLNFASATRFTDTWRNASNFANFPANMFDSTGPLISSAFSGAWLNCSLTVQSIENILVSLDTNGATNITLTISGGSNAAKTAWSTAANDAYASLITKGWTITYNA